MTIRKRLEALETGCFNVPVIGHRIVQAVGQSQDKAITLYGRDRIGPTDRLIIRRIVDVAA